jgi:hypothetical protein
MGVRVLDDFLCPIHGRDLVVVTEWDGDDRATWSVVHFACEATWPHHTFRAEPDGAGDFVPVVDDEDSEAAG